jgi:hypothetical protein
MAFISRFLGQRVEPEGRNDYPQFAELFTDIVATLTCGASCRDQ